MKFNSKNTGLLYWIILTLTIKNRQCRHSKIFIGHFNQIQRNNSFAEADTRDALWAFTGNHPKACNFAKKRLRHRCFPVKFEKFLRTPFSWNTSSGCFCNGWWGPVNLSRHFFFLLRLFHPFIFKIYCPNQFFCIKLLHEKCPNVEFFLVRIILHSDWIKQNTDQKNLRIWTLITQWNASSITLTRFQ